MLCVCLVFGLLFASSPLSYADDLYNIDVPFTYDEFYSFNDYLEAVESYAESSSGVSTYGTIDSSELTSENVSVRIYAGPYANWYTEESFSSTADLAYTKTFAISSLQSNLQNIGASNAKKPAVVFNSYFNPLWGYTVTYSLADDSSVSNSVLDFDLNFDGDTAYLVNNTAAQLVYNNSSFSNLGTVTVSSLSWAKNLVGSMPSLVGAGGAYNVSSNGTTYWIGGLHNTLSFIGITTSGEQISLGVYEDTTGGKYSIKLPSDVEFNSFVFDMSYYYASDGFPSSTYYSGYVFPYMYKCDFSGSITFNQNSVISGALSGILAWLKSIFNAITELPQKTADLVVNGVKSLFVPSSDAIMATFDTLKSTAESKLGFLYSIFQMVYDLFNSLASGLTDPMETLTIPRLSLPFKYVTGGELIIWEEMTFDIMPKGLEVLRDLVKLLTSLVLITATMSHCIDYFRGFFKKE